MKWNLKIKTILIFVFLLAYCLPLKATIHYVQHGQGNNPPYLSWSDAADSIQSAINVCAPGDTVLVANGVYYENLVIDSMLTLIGSSMDSTVIDGRGLGDITITVYADCNIENFNIFGKGEGLSNSIVIRSSSASTFTTVRKCRVLEAMSGIFITRSCIIDNVLFEKISRTGFANIGALTTVENNLINNIMVFDASNSDAIYAGAGNYNITNNIILFIGADNQGAKGISVGASSRIYIYNNLISRLGAVYFDIVMDTAFVKNNILTLGAGISSNGNRIYVNNVELSNNYIGVDGDALVKINYNLFWENDNDLVGLTYGDSDRVANPMFVKDTLPNPELDFDYHLQAYSPGIDKGDPNIFDIDSSRSDIGLYGGPFGETYTYQNLAPRPPVNLIAVVSKINKTITLSWNRNSEADTAYYNVYRDTTENFIISPENLISSLTDTFVTEAIPTGAESLYYKITAVDIDENESLPSEEIFIDIITGVKGEPVTINDYRLNQNYPNPFNPSTKIGYRLKERGYVKLMVYDIKGELVTVLVNKEQNAGYYEVEFGRGLIDQAQNPTKQLASGIYLYRIEVIGEGNIPVYSDMRKMVLIK